MDFFEKKYVTGPKLLTYNIAKVDVLEHVSPQIWRHFGYLCWISGGVHFKIIYFPRKPTNIVMKIDGWFR